MDATSTKSKRSRPRWKRRNLAALIFIGECAEGPASACQNGALAVGEEPALEPQGDLDIVAPKGRIAPARAALLRFAPGHKPRISTRATRRPPSERIEVLSGTVIVTPKPKAPLDEALERIARAYNQELKQWEGAPRIADSLATLENLRFAAIGYANALSALRADDVALDNVLLDAMLRSMNEGDRRLKDKEPKETTDLPALPFDDVTEAFFPEITAGEFWPNGAYFIQPSIDRALAVMRLASRGRDYLAGVGADKGGAGNVLARLGVRPPKHILVLACAQLIIACFDDEDVERISSTTFRPGAEASERPPFERFVEKMHEYAVGAEVPDNAFARAMKDTVPEFKRRWAKFKHLSALMRGHADCSETEP